MQDHTKTTWAQFTLPQWRKQNPNTNPGRITPKILQPEHGRPTLRTTTQSFFLVLETDVVELISFKTNRKILDLIKHKTIPVTQKS